MEGGALSPDVPAKRIHGETSGMLGFIDIA